MLLVVSALTLVACSDGDSFTCPDGSEAFVRYELFMGRSGPGGEVVSDQAWDAFLGDTVTPRFPDGLTVLDAQGQWRDSEGQILKERSKVLVILAPPGDDPKGLIDEVSDEYKRRFRPGVGSRSRERHLRLFLLTPPVPVIVLGHSARVG